MIVGGYSLHLYCCCEACRIGIESRKRTGGFAEFGGANRAQATRDARKRGWRVNYKAGLAWSPGHVKGPTDTADL